MTTIDRTLDVSTLTMAWLLMPCHVAVMSAVPRPAPVKNPFEVLEAILALLDVHVATLLMSCVLLSLNVPVAKKRVEVPMPRVLLAGVTCTATRAAVETVTGAVPEMLPICAVIVAEPAATADTNPRVAMVSLTVATPGAEDDHVAVVVTSAVVVSL